MNTQAAPGTELSAGTVVRVRAAFLPGHTRTPFYVRGGVGQIERFVGRFGNHEVLGHGLTPVPRFALCRVRFRMDEIWEKYSGPSDRGGWGKLNIGDRWIFRVTAA